MQNDLSVRRLSESDYKHWESFVAGCPSGSIFALPSYLDILCQATRGHFEIAGVFDGGELVGGTALYFERNRLGLAATRRALLSYHGPVIRDYATGNPATRGARQAAILLALRHYLAAVPCDEMFLSVRHPIRDVRPFIAAGWLVRPDYTFLVDLTNLAETWHHIDQNQRRLIHRAEERGLVCSEDDDYDSFFRLHLAVHQRKKSPLYLPEAAYKQFLTRLQEQNLCRLYHARLPNGQAVAGQLVLTGPHSVSHTVCAGSAAEYLATGATPFLRWKAFECLAGLGYRANDLTGAPYPHSVSHFKSELGGELVANWLITRTPASMFRLRRKAHSLITRGRRKLKTIWPPVLPAVGRR